MVATAAAPPRKLKKCRAGTSLTNGWLLASRVSTLIHACIQATRKAGHLPASVRSEACGVEMRGLDWDILYVIWRCLAAVVLMVQAAGCDAGPRTGSWEPLQGMWWLSVAPLARCCGPPHSQTPPDSVAGCCCCCAAWQSHDADFRTEHRQEPTPAPEQTTSVRLELPLNRPEAETEPSPGSSKLSRISETSHCDRA